MNSSALLLALAPAVGLTTVPLAAQDQLSPKVERRRTPLVEAIEAARPAVVSIDCNVKTFGFIAQTSAGTGVVIREEGVIVTNYHVVAPNGRQADEILVRFDVEDDATQYRGNLI